MGNSKLKLWQLFWAGKWLYIKKCPSWLKLVLTFSIFFIFLVRDVNRALGAPLKYLSLSVLLAKTQTTCTGQKPARPPRGRWITNQKNSGWTSVDRSTKATLSTYNTWIQLSRLQKIYHFQKSKLSIATRTFNGNNSSYATGPRPNACHVTMKMVDNTA